MAVPFHSEERNSATVLQKISMEQSFGSRNTKPSEEPEEKISMEQSFGSRNTKPSEEPEESWDVEDFAVSQKARARRPGPDRESQMLSMVTRAV